jgi:anti-anti-sigma regulatory factor
MATNDVWVKVDGERVVQAFEEAGEKLADAPAEVVLDFSSVLRIDPSALRAINDFAARVDGKTTQIILTSVNINIYKVLKLMKLTPRFAFRT